MLNVGSSLDIDVVLHEADAYLISHAGSLVTDEASPQSIWKWLRLADKAGLHECVSVLAAQAAKEDWEGCTQLSKLQELSPQVLQQLIMAVAAVPVEGSKLDAACSGCTAAGGASAFGGAPSGFSFGPPAAARPAQPGFTLSWVCDRCRGVKKA